MKTLRLLLAWAWIAIPLGWGIAQSVQKSLPLFDGLTTPETPNEKVPR